MCCSHEFNPHRYEKAAYGLDHQDIYMEGPLFVSMEPMYMHSGHMVPHS